MAIRRIGWAGAAALALFTFAGVAAQPVAQDKSTSTGRADVIAHEWGTFTTVAGEDGQAMEWLPLGGPTDLPCFVQVYRNTLFKAFTRDYGPLLNYEQARSGLKGKVRMETPVLYFYSAEDTAVDVAVRFPHGLFTEWYPAAKVSQLPSHQNLLKLVTNPNSSIVWKNVRIRPGTRAVFPDDDRPSHYYAARATDAAPIQVDDAHEKFLFYRGVGGFPVPISATLGDEETVVIRNLGSDPLPGVVLFSRHGDTISYRVHGTLKEEVALNIPAADGKLSDLRQYLKDVLVSQGLYAREAEAMVETWRDTWFEEGTRVFYIVPPAMIENILPLTITPAPAKVARAFVGRMDLITPAMVEAVAAAIAADDKPALTRYGRLLGPIGDRLMATTTNPGQKAKTASALETAFKALLARADGGC